MEGELEYQAAEVVVKFVPNAFNRTDAVANTNEEQQMRAQLIKPLRSTEEKRTRRRNCQKDLSNIVAQPNTNGNPDFRSETAQRGTIDSALSVCRESLGRRKKPKTNIESVNPTKPPALGKNYIEFVLVYRK